MRSQVAGAFRMAAEVLLQLAPFAGQGRGCQFGQSAGQPEDLVEPPLEPQGDQVLARLDRVGQWGEQLCNYPSNFQSFFHDIHKLSNNDT